MSNRTVRPIDCLEEALWVSGKHLLFRVKIDGCYYALVQMSAPYSILHHGQITALVMQYFLWYRMERRRPHHTSVVVEHAAKNPQYHSQYINRPQHVRGRTWLAYLIYETNSLR